MNSIQRPLLVVAALALGVAPAGRALAAPALAPSAPPEPLAAPAAPVLLPDPFAAPVAAVFHVEAGARLKSTLDDWAQRAEWSVSWELGKDFTLGTSAQFSGDFETVVNALVESLGGDVGALKVEMHQANRVVRVTEHGASRKE